MKTLLILILVWITFDLRDWRVLGQSGKERVKAKIMIQYFQENPDCGEAEINVFENVRTKEAEFYVFCHKREI